MSPERLVHHELCFGCGRTNLFGLLMELEPIGKGHVRGRGFVKQDHQGADPGTAHEGVLLAALSEAMGFACGPGMRPVRLELELQAPVPVGTFIDVEAQAVTDRLTATATAWVDDRTVATARAICAAV